MVSLGDEAMGLTKKSDARMEYYDHNPVMESNDYLSAADQTGKMTLGISLFIITCFVLMIICIASFVCGAGVSFCYLHKKQCMRDFHIV